MDAVDAEQSDVWRALRGLPCSTDKPRTVASCRAAVSSPDHYRIGPAGVAAVWRCRVP
ncbi:hypothetical protein H2136_20145 [Aeromonas hydrophila]|uniref:Uncharacterized protein n=1 Tax=Aeromonas hydrophila TaxID=644 RepID=A0A926IYR1_AERHY|nr:hypothetical protein [Aeromonas hydrophila]